MPSTSVGILRPAGRNRTSAMVARVTSTAAAAPSTNDLGNRTSASPFVRPEDYTIPAERPQTASSSAKFADWKSPARTAKQPPGGRSDMWNIFG